MVRQQRRWLLFNKTTKEHAKVDNLDEVVKLTGADKTLLSKFKLYKFTPEDTNWVITEIN